MLQWIVEKQVGLLWIRFIWLRIGANPDNKLSGFIKFCEILE
jgi:hypothetical protein